MQLEPLTLAEWQQPHQHNPRAHAATQTCQSPSNVPGRAGRHPSSGGGSGWTPQVRFWVESLVTVPPLVEQRLREAPPAARPPLTQFHCLSFDLCSGFPPGELPRAGRCLLPHLVLDLTPPRLTGKTLSPVTLGQVHTVPQRPPPRHPVSWDMPTRLLTGPGM